ncbi:DUF1360 domain-containing protein [Microbispora sp. RL4-1S]|uniref:DUF1360 domain-containing protein n=1 Tax=Microbispora oryzae TaxID=2806554 RepID=A0A940WMT6_9ACTN|nr:DUF1360 domain-containing protein [Microbispora oryzae]MBP2703509.1 DUF1360 domain-containing protein [Microbispora oryzae]
MTICVFLLALGVVLRVVRFINSDVLFAPVREAVERRYGDASKISYLLSCPWCASPYVAVPVMAAAYAWGEHPLFVVFAAAATASYLVGLISTNLDD